MGSAKVTTDEEAGSGATPGGWGGGGAGTLMESGPCPEGQPRTTEPLTPFFRQGPSQLTARGFSRVPPPSWPSSSGTPGASRRQMGACRRPEPGLGMWSKKGHRGKGPGGEDLGRGGAREGARGHGCPSSEAQGSHPTPNRIPSAPPPAGSP